MREARDRNRDRAEAIAAICAHTISPSAATDRTRACLQPCGVARTLRNEREMKLARAFFRRSASEPGILEAGGQNVKRSPRPAQPAELKSEAGAAGRAPAGVAPVPGGAQWPIDHSPGGPLADWRPWAGWRPRHPGTASPCISAVLGPGRRSPRRGRTRRWGGEFPGPEVNLGVDFPRGAGRGATGVDGGGAGRRTETGQLRWPVAAAGDRPAALAGGCSIEAASGCETRTPSARRPRPRQPSV